MRQTLNRLNSLLVKVEFDPSSTEEAVTIANLIIQTTNHELNTLGGIWHETGALSKNSVDTAKVCLEHASRPNASDQERLMAVAKARDALSFAFGQEDGGSIRAPLIAYYTAACGFALGMQEDANLWMARSWEALLAYAMRIYPYNAIHTDFAGSHVTEMLGIGVIHWVRSLSRHRKTRRELYGTCLAHAIQSILELEQEGIIKSTRRPSEDCQSALDYLHSLLTIT